GAHAEEGRQMEDEVRAAVDQGDLARVERAEDPVQGRHGSREGGPRNGLEFRDLPDHGGLDDERDGILPAIRWGWRYKVGVGGEGWAKVRSRVAFELAGHLCEMKVQIPGRVPSPPGRGQRNEDPAEASRLHLDIERDTGSVVVRIESVRVPDIGAGIPSLDRVSVRRIEDHML